ncbi:MAG: hypothetical protein LBB56_08795 [Chitinispirillales bacterium]|jgi:23S rRNA (uracil1939-C5)-methyltransferase|nr:hypothetical protein [Chitinispirillales bacterium]
MSDLKTVKIEKMVYGGCGLGRSENGVILIQGVIPGELVEYEPRGTRGGVQEGELFRVLEESPLRRNPPCEHAGVCGGCDWLYMKYDEQIRRKKEVFEDCISRIGKIKYHTDIEIFTANEFGYRIRAQIKIDRQNGRAGFYRKKTNNVVKINRCPLLADEINTLLTKLNSGTAALPPDTSSIKVLSGEKIASCPALHGLTDKQTVINVGSRKFLASGGSFFQANKFLIETLGNWARPFIGGGVCMDLYGGIGFFSLMFADIFSGGVLVENDAKQVSDANENFKLNRINHFCAAAGDAEKPHCLNKLIKERPHCIIADPPRPGLVKTVRKWLVETAPPVILYVSCNQSTFARGAFASVNGGYSIANMALFDLYPNTHHIESAAVFVKRAAS